MKFKLLATTALATAFMVGASSAFAAGFAVREQSAQYQGSSFAGNAAGHGLSVMFWNAAGAANVSGPGIHSESHFSLIVPRAEVTVTRVGPSEFSEAQANEILEIGNGGPLPAFLTGHAQSLADNVNADIDARFAAAGNESGNIGATAIVPASYASYEVFKNVFVGVATNSPFGLGTEPRDNLYKGSVLARSTKLFTTNVNPNVAFKVMPGVSVGAGLQLQFGTGKLKFATGIPNTNSTNFRGDGWAVGATAGIILNPLDGTRIGVGWRSKLRQKLRGKYVQPGLTLNGGVADGLAFGVFDAPIPVGQIPVPGESVEAKATLDLPDMITVSFEQAVSPTMRINGTFEWANWSTFKSLHLTRQSNGTTIQEIETEWDDSYFFAGGIEFDYTPALTFRGGVAYEISPTSSAEKRIISIPDANRVWLSAGGTYNLSEETAIDFAYTHIFVEDGPFNRDTAGGVNLQGNVEAAVDIVSGSFKSTF